MQYGEVQDCYHWCFVFWQFTDRIEDLCDTDNLVAINFDKQVMRDIDLEDNLPKY